MIRVEFDQKGFEDLIKRLGQANQSVTGGAVGAVSSAALIGRRKADSGAVARNLDMGRNYSKWKGNKGGQQPRHTYSKIGEYGAWASTTRKGKVKTENGIKATDWMLSRYSWETVPRRNGKGRAEAKFTSQLFNLFGKATRPYKARSPRYEKAGGEWGSIAEGESRPGRPAVFAGTVQAIRSSVPAAIARVDKRLGREFGKEGL